jgi:dedicated sortase system histidine kinase
MRISLRLKLALISLLLLLFPLLGIRLNSILKNSLIISQEDTLTLTAQAVSAALANRADLFDREQFHFLNQGRDLYLFQLSNTIKLDGSLEDWQPEFSEAEESGDESVSLHFRYLAGKQEKYLYALFDVEDDHVIYRNRKSLHLDRSDHLQIVIDDNNERRKYIVTGYEPGWINGFLMPDNPLHFPVVENRIQGVWQQTDKGYILEIRMPLALLGSKLAFTVADVDDRKTGRINTLIGTADLKENTEPGWLLTTSTAIEEILKSLDRPYARIRIVDRNQRVRAQVGGLREFRASVVRQDPTTARIMTWAHDLFQPLYRFFTTSFSADIQDHASQPTELDLQGVKEGLAGRTSIARYLLEGGKVQVMAAITPLYEQDEVIGAVVVEQTTNSILTLSNRLIEETISLSVLAFLLGGGVLFLFAFRISFRIRRLRNQAAAAITRDGRIHSMIRESKAGDEIGDLSRALYSMLGQLRQQVEHREKMADNLEHEMRTPLAGVAASLKNLQQELDNPPQQIMEYLRWAEHDVQRLEELLTSIREATTLTDALLQETQESFDLGVAVSMWLDHGWQLSFPDVQFMYTPPEYAVKVTGDPVRLHQALDKLVENAVSFHRPDTPVELMLMRRAGIATLQVINQGGTIDPAMQHQIFNSMVSCRMTKDDHPHLGLGLYIVRTILKHHGGRVSVQNLQNGRTGVAFTVTLPSED